MSFLDRIRLIRKVTNGKDYNSIGSHGELVTFFAESQARFAIVTNIAISQKLLESPSFSAINHLHTFLPPTATSNDLGHIQRFLNESPEFHDGEEHKRLANRARHVIGKYHKCCTAISSSKLRGDLEDWLESHSGYNASDLSKTVLALFFTQAGKLFHETSDYIFKSSHITERFGFFSAAPRIPRLYKFNQDIHSHMTMASLLHSGPDEQFLLLLLRIMGSAPLNSTLTGSINFLIERRKAGKRDTIIPHELRGQQSFSRILPTRFVLRRAKEEVSINGIRFLKNDIIFAYLAQAGGCPIRRTVSLPFGAGKHFCPGHRVSKLIIKTCLEALICTDAHLRCMESSANPNNISAFLSFE